MQLTPVLDRRLVLDTLRIKLQMGIIVRVVFALLLMILAVAIRNRSESHWDFTLGALFVIPALLVPLNLYMLYQSNHRSLQVSVRFLRIQLFFDTALVSSIVYLTGGAYSIFAFVYIVVIMIAGITLSQRDGLIAATAASLLLIFMGWLNTNGVLPAVLFARTVIPVLTYHEYSSVMPELITKILAFYLVGFVSGYWNLRVRRLESFRDCILNHMNTGFIIIDEQGAILTFNLAAQRILGYDENEIAGSPVSEVFAVQRGDMNPFILALEKGEELSSREISVLTNENRTVTVGITTSVLRSWTGEVIGVIGSFADLTDIVRLRRQVRVNDRLAAIGGMASELAHEIRNPVAVIRSSVEELARHKEQQAVCVKLAQIALRESDQLNHIVTTFLDYARGLSPERGDVKLEPLLNEVVDNLRCEVTARGQNKALIELHISDAAAGEIVRGNRSQLKQAFINIGKNGIEALPCCEGRVSVVVQPARGGVLIHFVDTGCGIPENALDDIFEPFYSTKNDGIGFGLTVVHKIITSHGGRITVDSKSGIGTDVCVLLPINRESYRPSDVVVDDLCSVASGRV